MLCIEFADIFHEKSLQQGVQLTFKSRLVGSNSSEVRIELGWLTLCACQADEWYKSKVSPSEIWVEGIRDRDVASYEYEEKMIIFTQIKPKYNKMSVFPSLLNLQTILIGESMDLKSGSLIYFYMLVDQSEEV